MVYRRKLSGTESKRATGVTTTCMYVASEVCLWGCSHLYTKRHAASRGLNPHQLLNLVIRQNEPQSRVVRLQHRWPRRRDRIRRERPPPQERLPDRWRRAGGAHRAELPLLRRLLRACDHRGRCPRTASAAACSGDEGLRGKSAVGRAGGGRAAADEPRC